MALISLGDDLPDVGNSVHGNGEVWSADRFAIPRGGLALEEMASRWDAAAGAVASGLPLEEFAARMDAPVDPPVRKGALGQPRTPPGRTPAENLLLSLRDEFERLQNEFERLQKQNGKLARENKLLQGQLENLKDRASRASISSPTGSPTVVSSSLRKEQIERQWPDYTEPPKDPIEISKLDSVASDSPAQRITSFAFPHEEAEHCNEAGESLQHIRSEARSPMLERMCTRGVASSKSVSMVFATEADNEESREERVENLRDWFESLVGSEEGLTAVKLLSIVHRVRGTKGSMTLVDVERVIDTINEIHASYLTEDQEDQRSFFMQHGRDELRLYLDSFADMIIYDRTEGIVEGVMQNFNIVRNSLMRTHIDDLVAFYAHIPPSQFPGEPARGVQWFMANCFEPFVGAVILINGLAIGVSSDVSWDGWDILDVAFTVFFIMEIVVKCVFAGIRTHFFGPDWSWNWFDGVIVALAVVDLILTWIAEANASSDSGASDFGVIRLARLARLTRMLRLLRVLRFRIFKELLRMVKGVVAGCRTLFWAFVMLFAIVYACGVMLRQTVGQDKHRINDGYNTVLFGSVPWSMFNAFRCFMSDCTLPDGTPIAGHLYELYGYTFVIPYSLMIMFIIFGIFNMVTAVFVENVIESARQKERLNKVDEQIRVGRLLNELIVELASKHSDVDDESTCQTDADQPTRSSSGFRQNLRAFTQSLSSTTQGARAKEEEALDLKQEIGREDFLKKMREKRVSDIIDQLELNVSDRSELFEICDADGSGTVSVGELISGIMKMRSAETKQDVVALLLGMRAIRDALGILDEIPTVIADLEVQIKNTNDNMNELQDLMRRRNENKNGNCSV